MSYGGLTSVLRTSEALGEESERFKTLMLTQRMVEHDLIQMVDRNVRDEFGDPEPAIIAKGTEAELLSLTRGGHPNPIEAPRSDLLRVAYRVEDGLLQRAVWYHLDRVPEADLEVTDLVDEVIDIRFRFLDQELEWQAVWPPIQRDPAVNTLPRAIELELEVEPWGRMRRVFTLR
jgi:general secretion pathway protein J